MLAYRKPMAEADKILDAAVHTGHSAMALRVASDLSRERLGDLLGMSAGAIQDREENNPPYTMQQLGLLISVARRHVPFWATDVKVEKLKEAHGALLSILGRRTPEALWEASKAFGGKVRAIADHLHLTTAEMGREVGVSQSLISIWQLGRGLPSPQNFEKLCEALERLVKHPEWKERVKELPAWLAAAEKRRLGDPSFKWKESLTFGDKLRALRLGLGFGEINEFAQELGLHVTTLGEYERNVHSVNEPTLDKIILTARQIDPKFMTVARTRELRMMHRDLQQAPFLQEADKLWQENMPILLQASGSAVSPEEESRARRAIIKSARLATGMNMRQFCFAMEINRTNYFYIENGEKPVSNDLIMKLIALGQKRNPRWFSEARIKQLACMADGRSLAELALPEASPIVGEEISVEIQQGEKQRDSGTRKELDGPASAEPVSEHPLNIVDLQKEIFELLKGNYKALRIPFSLQEAATDILTTVSEIAAERPDDPLIRNPQL